MECRRCQGLMAEHDFFDLEGTQGFMWMKGWRCMNCGHAEDPLRAANLRLHEATDLEGTNRSVSSHGHYSDYR